jgi:hypothetical protein
MKELKFTKQTSTVALVFFIAYVIYGIFYTPWVQLVISLAVAGIAYGMTDSYEVAVIVLLVINYLFPFYRGSNMKGVTAYRMEGFTDAKANEVKKRIQQMTGLGEAEPTVDGVGSKLSEGFADAGDSDLTLNDNKAKGENSKPVSASSKPSEVDSSDAGGKEEQLKKMTEMMSGLMKNMNKTTDLTDSQKPTKISEQDMPAVHQPQDVKPEEKKKKKEEFKNQASEGLFKLGQIPKDAKGGFHIDAGTTVMNAINSLKPDQIKAMTQDTKQLIDTQKSLMSMLQTFQPMVQEGKQMMDTFQEMFSPSMGASSGSSK